MKQMQADQPAIETKELRKVYDRFVAVANLSMCVKRGEVFGFLGPNGAGKTTSIKMLLGLVWPSSGQASLLGRPIGDPACRRKVGFLPEHFSFHEWMTAGEFLDAHGRLYGLDAADRRQRAGVLLERVGLGGVAVQRLGTFSKGMLQRIGLAQALLHRPELVFLDEPTSGLDPLGRRMVRDIIADLARDGVTVFLNSHLLGEVEVTCTRVAFIRRGRVVGSTALGDLAASFSRFRLDVGPMPDGVLSALQERAVGVDMPRPGRIMLSVASRDEIPALARWLLGQDVSIYAIVPEILTLEELFVQIMGEDDYETDGHHR
jgi:ABC-2 type transport system ATP-binding protein